MFRDADVVCLCLVCIMWQLSMLHILEECILCCSVKDLFVLCVACLTVFVNCLVKQFAMCLGVVAILLLNVMEVFSVDGCALMFGLTKNLRVVPVIPVCI